MEDYSIDVQIGVLALVCRHEDRKRRSGESRAFNVFQRDVTSESLMQVNEMTAIRSVCCEQWLGAYRSEQTSHGRLRLVHSAAEQIKHLSRPRAS